VSFISRRAFPPSPSTPSLPLNLPAVSTADLLLESAPLSWLALSPPFHRRRFASAFQNATSNPPHLPAHKVFNDLPGRRDWSLFVAWSAVAQF
jgi:hypothetical protein